MVRVSHGTTELHILERCVTWLDAHMFAHIFVAYGTRAGDRDMKDGTRA